MCDEELEEILAYGLAHRVGEDFDDISPEERDEFRLEACSMLDGYDGHSKHSK